jgi:hypothetical protein
VLSGTDVSERRVTTICTTDGRPVSSVINFCRFLELEWSSVDSNQAAGFASRGLIPSKSKEYLCFSNHPGRMWGPPTLFLNGFQMLFPRGLSSRVAKLIAHLHLVPSLRMSGVVPPPFVTSRGTTFTADSNLHSNKDLWVVNWTRLSAFDIACGMFHPLCKSVAMVTAIQKHVCSTLKPRMVTGRHAGSASTCVANNLDFFGGGGGGGLDSLYLDNPLW